ncbi:MAG: DUF937 domain-containing protein [Nonlabens sp.]
MNDILDLLKSPAGQQLISGAAKNSGANETQTQNVLTQALPLILGGMQKNAQTPEGRASLDKALDNPKHTGGGMMEMVGSIFGDGAGSPEGLLSEGNSILGHVFGSNKSNVESAISQKNGLDSGTVGKIIAFAAPIVMGYLNKKKHNDNPQTNDISGLLGSALGSMSGDGESGGAMGMLNSVLDKDGDGSALDDVAGMFLGGDKNKKGGGGLLGGLLG